MAPETSEIVLRSPRPGELSWLQHRHMQVMIPAHGWDERYECSIAEIVAYFARNAREPGERFWVAARGEEVLGCVGLSRDSEVRARLRLLFVEPEARGLGLGRRLVETCVAFARKAGYTEVVLWTVNVLTSARRIYADIGFERVGADASDLDASMCDETWLLRL